MLEPTTADQMWWGDEQPPTQADGPVTLAYIADSYQWYPGETVTFTVRLDLHEPLTEATLRVRLPHALQLGEYRLLTAQNGRVPHIGQHREAYDIVWQVSGEAHTRRYYQIEAEVGPTPHTIELISQASLLAGDDTLLAQERIEAVVRAQGRYLHYLPALYEQDDLMGRFLMLFESFWSPIQRQVGDIAYHFDPKMTPAHFLPWLATWLDLELDQTWPEERLRELVRWAIALHRSRGTKWGLLKYLEIYTGQAAEIIERRANNFTLGPDARLGVGVALGRGNVPHTFTVNLRLPALDIEDEVERARQEKARRRTIEAIIDRQKPAHTVYTLNLEIVSAQELPETPGFGTNGATATRDEISRQATTWFSLDDD